MRNSRPSILLVDPYRDFIGDLDAGGFDPRAIGPDSCESRCPGHNGSRHNLAITRGDDGRVLVHCHHEPSCSVEAITRPLGRTPADLFPTDPSRNGKGHISPVRPKAKKSPRVYPTFDAAVDALRRMIGRDPSRRSAYRDAGRKAVAAVLRFDFEGTEGKTFRPVSKVGGGWVIGDPQGLWPLYRLPDIAAAPLIVIDEGEKCGDLLAEHGFAGTTTAHGAKSPHKTDLSPLAGKEVVIIPDNDVPGERYADSLCKLLGRLDPPPRIRVVRLPLRNEGDDVEQFFAEGRTAEQLVRFIDEAPDWSAVEIRPLQAASGQIAARTAIEITTREHEVVDLAVAAIAREPNLFQRARSLVSVIEEVKSEHKKGIERPSGSPRIVALPNAQVRRLMTVHATWCRAKTDRNGNEVLAASHVPNWAVEMASTMGAWNGIRPLVGITEIPTFRPDGSLISSPGYDAETGLLYRPSIGFPDVPEKPSRDQVAYAVDSILHVVEDFPFQVDDVEGRTWSAWSAWLAALLTPMARFAIDGPTPLFLIDANTAGAGKTKLVDIIAILTTGREMTRGSYSPDEVEMEKKLLAISLAGDPLVLFDNVAGGGSIGGPALDRFLTARTMNGRILGRSEMTGELDVNTVLYATGNNLGLRGDSLRRIVPIPLQSPEERPEERQGFAIEGDLLDHVKRHRGELVSAALTILRGYIEAGRPDQDLTPMDYAAWSGLVRNAVNWATGTDPCQGRRELIANDDATNRNKALVEEWQKLCKLSGMSAISAGEALKLLDEFASQTQPLRDIMMTWSKDARLPSVQKVGNELGKIKGRVFGGNALCKTTLDGTNTWYVKPVRAPSQVDL